MPALTIVAPPSQMWHRLMAMAAMVLALLPLEATTLAPAEAGPGTPPKRAERTSFSDDEIVEGFLKTAFGAEYQLAGHVDRIRRYDGPVRVHIDSKGRPDRRTQLAGIVADIGSRVRHLDIAVVASRDDANVFVSLIRDRELSQTITTFYGPDRAREIRTSLDPQCLSGFRKNEHFAIERSDVILTVDNGDFIFRDCAYEELLQSLGPINDTDSVPWTMFNDDVQKGYFDVYDQHLLNILYDPRIRPGMTVADVTALLPAVLADVRVFVAERNKLPR